MKAFNVQAEVLGQAVEVTVDASSLPEAVNRFLSEKVRIKSVVATGDRGEAGKVYRVTAEVDGLGLVIADREAPDIFPILYQSTQSHVAISGVEEADPVAEAPAP